MDFRLLGPVGVWRGPAEVPLEGAKQRTLLAALLLARGRAVPTGRLRELLWGDDPPATYPAQIYNYVSRLRKQLGSQAPVVHRWSGYLIDIGDGRLDLEQFERLVALARQSSAEQRPAQAAQQLRAALALWRGPALSNVTDRLADAETGALTEQWFAATDHRISVDLVLGRHRGLLPELTRLVAQHPLRERPRAHLMIALHRSGRPSDAMAVYRDGRRVLAEELGIDPGQVLTDAYQEIVARSPGPTLVARPVMRAPAVAVGGRPAPPRAAAS